MAEFRAQQQAAYAISLAADREKVHKKKQEEEEKALRKLVEAEKAEAERKVQDWHESQQQSHGKNTDEEQEIEPEDPDYVKQKRLAFLNGFGGSEMYIHACDGAIYTGTSKF